MISRLRDGSLVETYDNEGKLIEYLYDNKLGRILLNILISPIVSRAAGWFLDTKPSALLVEPFIKKNHLDLSDYPDREYSSFNDFFKRKISEGKRTVNEDTSLLVSPCDGKLTVFPLSLDSSFTIKGTEYTLPSLLRNREQSKKYCGGYGILLRLTVDDYHRYIYPVSGNKSNNVHINGVFHTVNPKAASSLPIYKENSREYTIIDTLSSGSILMMEIGAMMVGRIKNLHGAKAVIKGEEKGFFEFGGSSIILLTEKDHYQPDNDLLVNSNNGYETVVKMGESIGKLINFGSMLING